MIAGCREWLVGNLARVGLPALRALPRLGSDAHKPIKYLFNYLVVMVSIMVTVSLGNGLNSFKASLAAGLLPLRTESLSPLSVFYFTAVHLTYVS